MSEAAAPPPDEVVWNRSINYKRLFRCLPPSPSERKLRLFAVACCASLRPHLTDQRSVHALTVARRVADGEASPEELRAARADAARAYDNALNTDDEASLIAYRLLMEGPAEATDLADRVAHYLAGPRPQPGTFTAHRTRHVALLRDVFNPFHTRPLDPAWRAFGDGVAVRLARAVYAEDAFDRLPILADALEDAGCDDASLLAHLRGPGPHVRGCWAVDLILGKV